MSVEHLEHELAGIASRLELLEELRGKRQSNDARAEIGELRESISDLASTLGKFVKLVNNVVLPAIEDLSVGG